jgi:hypothetical protein
MTRRRSARSPLMFGWRLASSLLSLLRKRCIALAGITIAEPFEHSPLTCGAIRRRGDFDKRLAENF